MKTYPLTDIIHELPASIPFVGPEAQERAVGKQFISRIGANENGFGPSPNAIAAMREAASDIWMYGDSENHDLRHALAEFHQVGYENIAVGEGIDALLGYTCRMFVAPASSVVTSQGAYPTFNFHVANNGGKLHFVPLTNDQEDIDALLVEAKRNSAVLLYVSNPNNPMASWHDAPALEELITKIPEEMVLILDEAYIEFAPEGTAPPFDVTQKNILRYRTFSKAYGMAGARIGYCIGEAGLISEMEKVRNHFGVNKIAQAGAMAALDDQQYLGETVKKIESAREFLNKCAYSHGFQALPSATNFVAIDCKRDEKYARAIVDGLAQKGVFIRMPGGFEQARCIRVSIGPERDMKIFDEVLGEVISELG